MLQQSCISDIHLSAIILQDGSLTTGTAAMLWSNNEVIHIHETGVRADASKALQSIDPLAVQHDDATGLTMMARLS